MRLRKKRVGRINSGRGNRYSAVHRKKRDAPAPRRFPALFFFPHFLCLFHRDCPCDELVGEFFHSVHFGDFFGCLWARIRIFGPECSAFVAVMVFLAVFQIFFLHRAGFGLIAGVALVGDIVGLLGIHRFRVLLWSLGVWWFQFLPFNFFCNARKSG